MFKCGYKGGQSSLFLFCLKGGENNVKQDKKSAVKIRVN